ncbi:MAG: hypothetical protein M1832_000874 [Thelocarpon impressellum]|nr:MAG: hypothetical protein M1832_000874 [Thelocarpon impressellum]
MAESTPSPLRRRRRQAGSAPPRKNGIAAALPADSSALGQSPTLFHRVQHNRSILSLAVSDSCLFAGTQGGEILVWSLETYELVANVNGHNGSVLGLFLSKDGNLLFSCAGDRIVNVWSPRTLERLYSIYSTYDIGDVFTVAYSSSVHTVYFGAQNTSIQWYDLDQRDVRPPPDPENHPHSRNHRFFDSVGPGGLSTPRPANSGEATPRAQGGQVLEVDKDHIRQFAHYGYVYCMILGHGLGKDGAEDEMLISGGGDGSIKLWNLDGGDGSIGEASALDNGYISVVSMALDGTILYAGLIEGQINVWDLDTRQRVRTVRAHAEDVLTLSVGAGFIYSGGAGGFAKKFTQKYECTSRWEAHAGLILASALKEHNGRQLYVTGGNDCCVAIWDVSGAAADGSSRSTTSNEELLESLSSFIGYRTVSSDPAYAEDNRRGASFLRSLFKRFGASAEMLNTAGTLNPVVFARFKGNSPGSAKRRTILFYGHYDVIAARNEKGTWKADPFVIRPVNGYVYGRGASDNKGPVLAALYAAAELARKRALEADVVFLIEGEEECGSRGFADTVRKNKDVIGRVDYIVLANSYWLDDQMPCLTYGLRGLIQATVTVKSDHPELHSGVDGSSYLDEPLKDLIAILARLNGPRNRVMIPGFYDPMLAPTAAEEERYAAITASITRRYPTLADPRTFTAAMKQRSREASLTVHRFAAGPENTTIIPNQASAGLSIRLVPNQDIVTVKRALHDFLHQQFAELQSKNHLAISIDHEADPWLGDPDNEIFRALEEAVMEVWGPIGEARPEGTGAALPSNLQTVVSCSRPATSGKAEANGSDYLSHPAGRGKDTGQRKPLYVREGGSIPAIRFLEKEFDAPAAHLPCGQASDAAHLDNERIRLRNLYQSREIFKRVFGRPA